MDGEESVCARECPKNTPLYRLAEVFVTNAPVNFFKKKTKQPTHAAGRALLVFLLLLHTCAVYD